MSSTFQPWNSSSNSGTSPFHLTQALCYPLSLLRFDVPVSRSYPLYHLAETSPMVPPPQYKRKLYLSLGACAFQHIIFYLLSTSLQFSSNISTLPHPIIQPPPPPMPHHHSHISPGLAYLADQKPKHKDRYSAGGAYHTHLRPHGKGWRGKTDPLIIGAIKNLEFSSKKGLSEDPDQQQHTAWKRQRPLGA